MVLWMGANKIKSTGSPTIFCFPRLHSTCFAHRFSYSSAIHGSLFTGYVICRLDREKGILTLVVTNISCLPPPQIISARYITVEPRSSKQSRFLIIENYMTIDVVFLITSSIISKDDYPQQQQKCTVICGIANSSVSAFRLKHLFSTGVPFKGSLSNKTKLLPLIWQVGMHHYS